MNESNSKGDDNEGGKKIWSGNVWKVVAGVIVGGFIVREVVKHKGTLSKGSKSKGATISIRLREGDTLGGLITKYLGDYTEKNVNIVRKLNKKHIQDIDFLEPGMIVKIPDNRVPELATAEADWWKRRARSLALSETNPSLDKVNEDFQKWEMEDEKKSSRKQRWGKKKQQEPENKIKLLQDEW